MGVYLCQISDVYSTFLFFFFFNDTATTEIYPLSLHDALPISRRRRGPPPACEPRRAPLPRVGPRRSREVPHRAARRSEEHTSELQSHSDLVCRLLLEKKKQRTTIRTYGMRLVVTMKRHAAITA